VDGYLSQAGTQSWQRALSGTAPRGHATVDRGTPAWELDTTAFAVPSGVPHEESWSIAPTTQDLDLANARGWTLRARLRLPTKNDALGAGAAVYYNASDRLWTMQFGTDANGRPIVGLRGAQNQSYTIGTDVDNGKYHDYVLRYDPIAGKATLLVDGSPRLFDYVGITNPNHPAVGFGDATISDGSHALYEVVEWTNCAATADGTACQPGTSFEPHIEYRADPYPGLVDGYLTEPGKQTWTLNGTGNLDGKPIVELAGIGWDMDSTGDIGHEEFWTLSPTTGDIALAQQRGWTLSSSLRVPTASDSVGPGVALYYADGARGWLVEFGTDAAGKPIVGIEGPPGNITSVALTNLDGGYHDYALRYDPAAGSADLFVDGTERLSNYAGFATTQAARVSFGDLALGDSGRGQYASVEWTNCSAANPASCPADTGRIRYRVDPDPTQQNGYIFGRTPQPWTITPAGGGQGDVDGGSLIWDMSAGGRSWSVAPTETEVAAAKTTGYTLTTRLRYLTAGDDPEQDGAFFEFEDGVTLWRMAIGTDPNADPIVQLAGNGQDTTFTLHGAGSVGNTDYHTYVLKYDPVARDMALLIDGITRVPHYSGRTASGSPRVSFGSRGVDGGHVFLHDLGWATPSFPGCTPGGNCCGDGYRDIGAAEECDPGSTPGNVMCSSICRVQDFLVVQPPSEPVFPPSLRANRTLGSGRHTVAGNDHSFAVAFTQEAPSPASVRLQILSSTGQRLVNTDLGEGGPALLESNPVVAALPGENYAVAWNDFRVDGDELGVALKLVDSRSGTSTTVQHANTTVSFSQYDPDLVWTKKNELVVAWVDGSRSQTGPDVRYRIFNAALAPVSNEQTLATDVDVEADVALTTFGQDWAAAWRSGKDGLETIHVKAGTIEWSVGPFVPGADGDKPALAELDATHLLLVYTEGTDPKGTGVANVPALRAALLDTASPGLVPGLAVFPNATSGDPIGQRQPNAVHIGNQTFMAWRGDSPLGDARAEELWLQPVKLSTSHALLDLTANASPLPRQPDHRVGDQRRVALAELPHTMQETWLLSAWDDYGTVFGATEGQPDIVAQVTPLPVPPVTQSCNSPDVTTDAHNCGTCGHDCLGGTCVASQCQAFAWATGMPSLMGVEVVGADVYATYNPSFDQPPGPNQATGALVRVSPDGTKTFLENGVSFGASSLWFDKTTYSFIWPDFMYTNVGTRPLQAPSGSITTLFSNHISFPFGLATTPDAIYFTNWGYVDRVPPVAGKPAQALDTMEKRPRSNVAQFESFQLTDADPQESHPFHASHFDVDSTYLYWAESQTGQVVRRRLDTPWSAGPSKEVITTVSGNARGIAVDGSVIYVTTYGQPDASPPGKLFRVDNQIGSTAVLITTIPGNLEDVAVDAKAVYVAGRTSGTIWKLAR
jgi:hypothetical protein